MNYPKLHIIDGANQHMLELAFISRNTGGVTNFMILSPEHGPMVVAFRIYNFSYNRHYNPNYHLYGQLVNLTDEEKSKLPKFNGITVDYDAKTFKGTMEFSTATTVEIISQHMKQRAA